MKIKYIHLLRGVAIFFIVAIHTNMFVSNDGMWARVYTAFLSEWTAVFVLISGFLFHHLLPRYEAKKYYLSKVKNVIFPYLLISVPAICIYVFGFKNSHAWVDLDYLRTQGITYQVAFFYLTGSHLGPLWFIPTLCLIYLTAPVLKILGESDKYIFGAALVSLVVIFFTRRPDNDSNAILAYVHFLPVYVVGMFISSRRKFLIESKNEFFMMAMYGFGVLLFVFVSIYFRGSADIFQKIFMFLFLAVFFVLLERRALFSRFRFALAVLADVSFSIYFIHGYFVGALRGVSDEFGIHSLLSGAALGISFAVLFVLATWLLSYGVKVLLKERSRVIIGS